MTQLKHRPLTHLNNPNTMPPSPSPTSFSKSPPESIETRIRRITKDMEELHNFNPISISERTFQAIHSYLLEEQDQLKSLDFDDLDIQGQADFILLRNYLERQRRQLEIDAKSKEEIMPALPFADLIIEVSADREDVKPLVADKLASMLNEVAKLTIQARKDVESGKIKMSTPGGYRAVKVIAELRLALDRLDEFYSGYHPLYDWWCRQPYDAVSAALDAYLPSVQQHLAGQHPDRQDEIVGRPIGKEALLVELEAEMVAYSPEELIQLAKDQYAWAEGQMKAASAELGYGDDWKRALEHTKNDCVAPGEQDQLVARLASESERFIKDNDLATVPKLARSTHRTLMMTPENQKTTPFLTGGYATTLAYPTAGMEHDLKRMVMRGNSRGMTHAVVFHEQVPGHRLQVFHAERYNTHRWLFINPFVIEGWGMYWEMHLWNRGDFFLKPVDKVGTLFWRMHRSWRIILSLQFHLGRVTPQEMVDRLVERVGHERAMAEAEVRRWINGEWQPLYQCGYMVGALQLVALRREALQSGRYAGDREFNDAVLRSNFMPLELMRAVLLGKKLSADYKPSWRFYGDL